MKTSGQVIGVTDLDTATVSAMYELMARYWADFDRQRFEDDLADKDDVVLIHAGEALVGFTTVQLRYEEINGQSVRTVFSGDTIVDKDYWDTNELQRTFAAHAAHVMRESEVPLYWLLICGGYRTYRYLPLFFHEFWPCCDKPTPADIQALIDHLATHRFGDSYQNGVVVEGNGSLQSHVSPISERHRRNPHIAFFEQANPGHLQGHELVCIAEVCEANMTRVLKKLQPESPGT